MIPEETRFVHFGHFKFSKNALLQRSEGAQYMESVNYKPDGLWASPKLDELEGVQSDWSDWCYREDYDTEKLNVGFSFGLTEEANILCIDSPRDILPYISNIDEYESEEDALSCMQFNPPRIDFQQIYSEYDGMYVPYHENYPLFSTSIFINYDVDSLCVWNPDVVCGIESFKQNFDKVIW